MSLYSEKDPSNKDHYSIIERHPRSRLPIIPILVTVVLLSVAAFLSVQKFEIDELIDIVSSGQIIQEIQRTGPLAGAKSVHQLISEGNVEEVKRWSTETNAEALNDVVNGMTPIMLAASTGNVEIMDLLFSQGADPNKRGSSQRTALQYAAEKNHIAAVKSLLSYGADIDAYDNGRLTPLIMAADRGYTELGLLFIDKGANVNIQHVQGWTALIDAVVRNNVKLVEALLSAGADKSLETNKGIRAIDYANQYGFINLVEILSD